MHTGRGQSRVRHHAQPANSLNKMLPTYREASLPSGKNIQNGERMSSWQQRGIATIAFSRESSAVISLTNRPRWPAITTRMVSGCMAQFDSPLWPGPCPRGTGHVQTRRSAAWDASDQLTILVCRGRDFLPVYMFVSPTADLQALGQFPLAHSLRPFHLDIVPL